MPRISEIFGTGSYRAVDIPRPLVVTIDGYGTETDRYRGDEIYVLHFRDSVRTLRLTQSNAADIARLHGDEIANWVGCEIELYVEEMTIRDRQTGADKQISTIRARAPASANGPLPPTRDALDDEIPF
jgi:hypothetical protein